MMLTPEQRPTLTISNDGRVLTETIEDIELPADYSFATINDYVHDVGRQYEELQCLALGMASHIDAQQARIAELEALLQSASADCNATANERNELRTQNASLLSLLADIRAACGDNGKRMQDELVAYIGELEQDAANAAAAERERIKKICGDVIDEWFNCAGGADEVLRRIEEYEQNGEAKP